MSSKSSSKQNAAQTTVSTQGNNSPGAGRDLGPVNLSSGQQLVTGNKSTVNLLDGGAISSITQIAETALGILQKNTTDQGQTLSGVLQNASDLASVAQANNQMLAANAATGGASTASSTIIKILGGFAVVIVIGLGLYFSRKK